MYFKMSNKVKDIEKKPVLLRILLFQRYYQYKNFGSNNI